MHLKRIGLFILTVSPFLVSAQSPAEPVVLSIQEAALNTIKLKGSPDFLAVDRDDVWILNTNSVQKLSAAKRKPRLKVNVPGACGAMIVGANSLWVASCGERSIYRIDTNTGEVLARIATNIADVNGEISLAFGDNALWILSDSAGILTRINASTNIIENKITVLANSYCAVYEYDAVWITNSASNSVQRIDPKTNTVVATIPVGRTPRFLAAGEQGVWTINQNEGTVSRIDPLTNTVTSVIDTKIAGTGGDIATGGNRVWVRGNNNRLLQTINPKTNTIETIFIPVAGSGAVRVSEHFIWVTAHDINTVWILTR